MSTVNIPPGVKPVSDSGVQPHILVVDDARDIREPLVRYLRESGYRASAADGAQAARRLMRTSAIDLVILDIMMPGEDGLSLCRSIRENSGIPVIMLTGVSDKGKIREALDIGIDYYIVKPFEFHDLVSKVRLAISDAGAPGALSGEWWLLYPMPYGNISERCRPDQSLLHGGLRS